MMNYYPLLLLAGLALSGCVSKKTLQTAQADHQRASDSLNAIVQQLRYEQDTLHDALTFERGANYALLTTQDKLQDRLDVLQEEIDQLGNNASSTQQSLNTSLRQKNQELAERQQKLDDIESLLTRDEERLNALATALRIRFDSLGVEAGWEATISSNQLRLSISEDNLFRRNSTSSITSTGKALLQSVADSIRKYPELQILAIGHTDNQPVTRQSLDNWQYSALRAVSVVKFLTGEGELGSNRVMAAAKSEFAPLESNQTAAGRERNRRVDLIISARRTDLQRNIRRVIGN
ncbi:MAG: OmpA family protein [Bacteroidota bacterium]